MAKGGKGSNPKTALYVGGLESTVNESALHSAFIPFGDIKEVSLPMDHATGQHRGFGFVEFEAPEDAAAAMDNMHNSGGCVVCWAGWQGRLVGVGGWRQGAAGLGRTDVSSSSSSSSSSQPALSPATLLPAELYGRVLRVNYAQPNKIKGGDKGWSSQAVWADADDWWVARRLLALLACSAAFLLAVCPACRWLPVSSGWCVWHPPIARMALLTTASSPAALPSPTGMRSTLRRRSSTSWRVSRRRLERRRPCSRR